jgi:putative transposase
MFDSPPATLEAIYRTNAIESVNSTIREFTRDLEEYPSAESAVKLIRPAIGEASRRRTMPIVGWKQAPNHFAILCEGRMPPRFTR